MYTIKRLLNALNGDENELIELTLLLQQDEFMDDKIFGLILEYQHKLKPTHNSRYLLAWYSFNNKDVTEQEKFAARAELQQLAKEGYLLAENISTFLFDKTDTEPLIIPDKLANSNNYLIKANVIYCQTQTGVKKQFRQLTTLYKKLNPHDNRYLRRVLVKLIVAILITDSINTTEKTIKYNLIELAASIRKFFIDNQLYSDYINFLHSIEPILNEEQKAFLIKLLSQDKDGTLPFSKNELKAFFNRVNNIREFVDQTKKNWDKKILTNFAIDELQEDIFVIHALLDKKLNWLNSELDAIEENCRVYAQKDLVFGEQYQTTKFDVKIILTNGEEFIDNMLRYLRLVAGTDPLIEKHYQELKTKVKNLSLKSSFSLLSNASELLTESPNNKQLESLTEKMKKTSQELNQAQKKIREQTQIIYQNYNMLLTVITTQLVDPEVVSKLNTVQLNIPLDDLAALQEFSNKWCTIFSDAQQTEHPLNKVKPLLEAAWMMISSQIAQKEDPSIAKLYQEYNESISRYDTLSLPNSIMFASRILIAAKHHLNKIAALHLDGPLPNFSKAHKLLRKMDKLIEDTECANLFNSKDQYTNLKKMINQFETLYRIKHPQEMVMTLQENIDSTARSEALYKKL